MSTSTRFDIYAFIHKGLRAFMAHALVRVGRLDVADDAEVAEVSEEVAALLEVCRTHLRHENEVIHPAMQARAPASPLRIAAEHEHHERTIATLAALLARVPGDAAAARALYQTLARFVAENFEHMEREETDHNAVLWATHTDDELRALEQRIVASATPESRRTNVRWMLPHLTPAERAAKLGELRAHAPATAFASTLSEIRPLLGGRDWRKLAVALEL